jgi:hypothetical protein
MASYIVEIEIRSSIKSKYRVGKEEERYFRTVLVCLFKLNHDYSIGMSAVEGHRKVSLEQLDNFMSFTMQSINKMTEAHLEGH